MQIIVADKHIQASGRTDLFVQHEINAGPIEFIFSNPDALLTSALTYKLYYKNENDEFDYDLLTYSALTTGFKLTWNPSAAATSCSGKFVFNITALNADGTLVWKTFACAVGIARDIDGQPLEYGNLEQLLVAFEAHIDNAVIHVTSSDKTNWNGKSTVTVSPTGTATDEVQYITINGVEKKLSGGSGGGTITDVQKNGVSVVVSGVANITVPTKTSEITNDSGFVSDISGKVDKTQKVNGKALAGDITLDAEDVGALPEDTPIPTKTSDLDNDSDFISETEADDKYYQKPASGIPKTDLASDVQTSLGKADTAIQEHQSLSAYRTSADQDVIDRGKVSKEENKRLMTSEEGTKLAGIETGAEVNIVNGIKRNSTALTPDQDGIVTISVPINASDVAALPNTTKYGASLTVEMDSSTYVCTFTLKDQDGATLGSVQSIDLPLESVVVSGSYNAQTKKVVLTLKNGSTIEFSVADLISGLVSATDLAEILTYYYTSADTDTLLATKVDKVAGKGLSTNDYDNSAKAIVDDITDETWTFTLDDDTTVTKVVKVGS